MSILKIDPEILAQIAHKKSSAAHKKNEKEKENTAPKRKRKVKETPEPVEQKPEPVEQKPDEPAKAPVKRKRKLVPIAPKAPIEIADESESIESSSVSSEPEEPKVKKVKVKKVKVEKVKVEKTAPKPKPKPKPKARAKKDSRPTWFLNYLKEGKKIEADPVQAVKTASDVWDDAKQRAKISTKEQTHQHRMYNMIFGR